MVGMSDKIKGEVQDSDCERKIKDANELEFAIFCVVTISNENVYVADNRDEDVQNRMFRMSFTFKNKRYGGNRRYYLAAYDV